MKLIRKGASTALSVVLMATGHAAVLGCVGDSVGEDQPGNQDHRSGSEPGAAGAPPVEGAPVVGVFVSSTKGSDEADGTRWRPLQTLAAGIAMARVQDLPVIACAEAYEEAVTLIGGVSVYGAYDCTDLDHWKRGGGRARIVSPSSPAVLANDLAIPTRFEGFEIFAPDIPGTAAAGAPAESSYGMIVRSSKDLTLADLVIQAGKGQDGVHGVEPAGGNEDLSSTRDGKGAVGGEKKACSAGPPPLNLTICNFDGQLAGPTVRGGSAGGTSQCKVGANGGPGGHGGGGRIADDGVFRTPYQANDTKGQPLLDTPTTAARSAGSTGEAGPSGASGAWTFSIDGFVPGDGAAGGLGSPGQGGGGGNGATFWAPNSDGVSVKLSPPSDGTYALGLGGGGGAGGCGGLPGTPGSGGGASVGLFVVSSENIHVLNARVEGKQGGRGGRGTLGTNGTPGGAGGARPDTGSNGPEPGERGFPGGAGGASGVSGHGAPGPSIALAFHGVRPQTTGTELVAGTPGEEAPLIFIGEKRLPAVTGVAMEEHSF